MGKLSHIADIERRNAEQAEAPDASAPAPSAGAGASVGGRQAGAPAEAAPVAAVPEQAGAGTEAAPARRSSQADAEEDFHGLDSSESFGKGHTALAVLAAIVFVAAVAYVLNYWLHFV